MRRGRGSNGLIRHCIRSTLPQLQLSIITCTDQGGPALGRRKGPIVPRKEASLRSVAPCISFRRAPKEILLEKVSGERYTTLHG
jgi:hypothetical protein